LDTAPDFDRLRLGQLDDLTMRQVGAGAAAPWKQTTKLKRRITLPFLFSEERSEWRAFRDFFAARKGLLEGFWLPTWITDYRTETLTPAGSFIDIDPIGLVDVHVADEQHAYLAIIENGVPPTIAAHEIASVAIVGDKERLTLVEPIGTHMIGRTAVCPLLYVRLGDGDVSYEFVSDGVVRCSVEFVELPREYVTPNAIQQPIELYEFTRGGVARRLAEWGEGVVAGDELWASDSITRSSLRSDLEFTPESLQLQSITDREDHPLRYQLTDRGALDPTTFRAFTVDAATLTLDEDDPIYVGRVDSVQAGDNGRVDADVGSVLRLAEQQLPRTQSQRLCNHRTYDGNCGLTVATFTTAGTLIGVTSDYVEATAFGTKAAAESDANWFALGTVTVGTEKRLCVGASVNKLYIDVPFRAAAVGQAVSATAGDDKRIGTCLGKFNNVVNFMGAPYQPSKNPNLEELMNPKPPGGKKS
jgi:hypothetical protein